MPAFVQQQTTMNDAALNNALRQALADVLPHMLAGR